MTNEQRARREASAVTCIAIGGFMAVALAIVGAQLWPIAEPFEEGPRAKAPAPDPPEMPAAAADP